MFTCIYNLYLYKHIRILNMYRKDVRQVAVVYIKKCLQKITNTLAELWKKCSEAPVHEQLR